MDTSAPLAPPPPPPPPPTPPPGAFSATAPTADHPRTEVRRRPWRLTSAIAAAALVGGAVGGGLVAATVDDQPAAVPGHAVAAAPVSTSGAPLAIHDLVTAVRPSVVSIHTEITETDPFGRTADGSGAGTGFILSEDGLVVTNAHVVDGATSITVTDADHAEHDAELVAADPVADLAVIRFEASGLTPLAVGDSDALRVGDPVVAVGNALDLGSEPTVTSGIVSATERSLVEPNGNQLTHLIQTDTAINPGNSGGPLLDAAGQVVGINTAVAGQSQNIGFAIAINPAMHFVEQLRAGAVPDHPLLGVSTTSQADTPGATVVRVEPGSGADDAGLREGDVIVKADGRNIEAPEDLGSVIAGMAAGDRLDLDYVRDGSTHSVTAVLGSRPSDTAS